MNYWAIKMWSCDSFPHVTSSNQRIRESEDQSAMPIESFRESREPGRAPSDCSVSQTRDLLQLWELTGDGRFLSLSLRLDIWAWWIYSFQQSEKKIRKSKRTKRCWTEWDKICCNNWNGFGRENSVSLGSHWGNVLENEKERLLKQRNRERVEGVKLSSIKTQQQAQCVGWRKVTFSDYLDFYSSI